MKTLRPYPRTSSVISRLKRRGCNATDLYVNRMHYVQTDKYLAAVCILSPCIKDGRNGLYSFFKRPKNSSVSFFIILTGNRHYVIPAQDLPNEASIPFTGKSKYNKYIENWGLMV